MKLKIKTRPFGEVEIDERQVIDFPEGIPGFDFVKKFAVIDNEDEKSPFKWLQALEEPELAFVIIQPHDFMRSYEPDISKNDYKDVKAQGPQDVLVFAIVTIPSNPSEMTANLQGPIIINPHEKLGKQAISLTDRYGVKHGILAEIKKSAEGGG